MVMTCSVIDVPLWMQIIAIVVMILIAFHMKYVAAAINAVCEPYWQQDGKGFRTEAEIEDPATLVAHGDAFDFLVAGDSFGYQFEAEVLQSGEQTLLSQFSQTLDARTLDDEVTDAVGYLE